MLPEQVRADVEHVVRVLDHHDVADLHVVLVHGPHVRLARVRVLRGRLPVVRHLLAVPRPRARLDLPRFARIRDRVAISGLAVNMRVALLVVGAPLARVPAAVVVALARGRRSLVVAVLVDHQLVARVAITLLFRRALTAVHGDAPLVAVAIGLAALLLALVVRSRAPVHLADARALADVDAVRVLVHFVLRCRHARDWFVQRVPREVVVARLPRQPVVQVLIATGGGEARVPAVVVVAAVAFAALDAAAIFSNRSCVAPRARAAGIGHATLAHAVFDGATRPEVVANWKEKEREEREREEEEERVEVEVT